MDNSHGSQGNSYVFPGKISDAQSSGAIAALYNIDNGEFCNIFFFTEEEVQDAEQKYVNNSRFSVEYFNNEI